MGPGGLEIPQRAASVALGRDALRLGGLRSSSAGQIFPDRDPTPGGRSTSPVGRRGRRRSLPRVPSGHTPQQERAHCHVEHGKSFTNVYALVTPLD